MKKWIEFLGACSWALRYEWHDFRGRQPRRQVSILASAKTPEEPFLLVDYFYFHRRAVGRIFHVPMREVIDEWEAWKGMKRAWKCAKPPAKS